MRMIDVDDVDGDDDDYDDDDYDDSDVLVLLANIKYTTCCLNIYAFDHSSHPFIHSFIHPFIFLSINIYLSFF